MIHIFHRGVSWGGQGILGNAAMLDLLPLTAMWLGDVALDAITDLCNISNDRAPVDFIYRCPIFKRVADTWLSHWGRDKIAAISQTTFSNSFSLTHLPLDKMAAISQTIISDAFLCEWKDFD